MDLEVKMEVYQNGKRAPQFELHGQDFDGHLTLADFFELTKSTLILTANQVLREEQASGFDQHPVVIVDGRIGKPVIDVSPLGSIQFQARADVGDILIDTMQAILDRSPVKTGTYLHSNFVYFNSDRVATDMASLKAWLATNPSFNDKDLLRFVNIQPYARKLERAGIRAGTEKGGNKRYSKRGKGERSRSILVPNGAYYITNRVIRNKYKRNSIIRFEFIPGTQLGLKGSFIPRKGKPGRPYLYPSILISVQESGTV